MTRKWKQTLTDILIGLFLGTTVVIGVGLMTSCNSHIEEADGEGANLLPDSPDGLDGMTLNLQIHTADYLRGSRSTTGGIEGIAKGAMQLFCFDSDGGFIGMAQDVDNTPSTTDGKSQTLRATIPSTTTNIHLLANAHITPDASWQGKSEAEVMGEMESKYDTHQQLVYWGHIQKNSVAEMKAFLENTNNVVSLLRDRAKITTNIQDTDISKVELTVCNAFASGNVLALKTSNPEGSSTSQGSSSSEGASTSQGSSLIEGYDLTKVNLPADPSQRIDGTASEMSEVAYAFEHPNRPGDYLRPILRVTYKDGTVRYHHICLENDLHESYPILRNHEYRINIIKLGKDTGYADFEGAANGDPSNNAFVMVDDIVPEVSDGKHSLLIEQGTSIVYNAGVSTEQVITFTYTGGTDMAASDFKVTWIENNRLASSPSLSYNAATGKGEIRYQLQAITAHLKTAKLHLLDTKHGLSRTIHLYSITQFDFQPSFTSSYGENKLGKEIGNTTTGTGIGTLTLQVPADYPEDLLPVEFKIASNDINPKDLGVEVSSTADVDGSAVDSSITPWNCWFVYKANSRGTHTITIKNVRAATAGTSGKFFIKAKYFGNPQEITFKYQ